MAYGKLKVDTITYDDSGTDVDVSVSALAGAGSAAPLNSPAFTGTPTAPTAAVGTNTTQLATTAFVTAASPDISGKADTADIGVTIQPYDADTAKRDEPNTFTDSATFNGGIEVDGLYKQKRLVLGNNTSTIDISQANYFNLMVNQNTTFNFTNAPPSGTVGSFTLVLFHAAGTISWPGAVKWPANTAPTLATGKYHVFSFHTVDGGSKYYGAALVDYN